MAVSKPLPGQPIDRTAPLAQNLLAAWAFNEGGGGIAQDSFGRLPGTLTNFAYSSASGWSGGGLKLDGTNDYVAISTGAIVNGLAKYSIHARVTIGSVGTVQSFYGENISAGVVNAIHLKVNGTFTGYIHNGADNNVTSTTVAQVGKTYDVTMTVDSVSRTMKLYVNGMLESTNTSWSGTYSSSITLSAIGRFTNPGGYYFNGLVQVCYLYRSVLHPSSVSALAQNPWQLWPDEQLVFDASAGPTGNAATEQVQTSDATGIAGIIGDATSSQAQTADATGLVGTIGDATAEQAQTADATGLVGTIGDATTSQRQTSDATGSEVYAGDATTEQAQTADATGLVGTIGDATAEQAQTADATGLVGTIGDATTEQAQTTDAVGAVGIVGACESGQAQGTDGTGDNQSVAQMAPPHGGQYIISATQRKPLKLKAAEHPSTSRATCRPRLRTVCRAVGVARSADTCRPRTRQHMRAIGASRSALTVASARIPYNATWHAQRERDEQTLLLNL